VIFAKRKSVQLNTLSFARDSSQTPEALMIQFKGITAEECAVSIKKLGAGIDKYGLQVNS
jgi:hypothetical protein